MRPLFFFFILLLASQDVFAERIVNQVNIFSGEVASNLTVGAPLVVSSTGKVATGLTTSSVESVADTTTTSATDVLINLMTLTPVSGTYLVYFCTTIESGTNNANIFVSIYANAAQVLGTEMSGTPQIQGGVTPSLNMRVPICTIGLATVNGAQAIEARWRRSAGTATSHTRNLTILRVQ